jgi:hypothetical protein
MRTAMRPRYYCDFCKKASGSPSFMRRHESGCTNNPNRTCRMCALLAEAGGPDPAPPRADLIKVMDTSGFNAMREAANDCPACILSVLRTYNFEGDAGTPGGVRGPEDGRESWSYQAAKTAWWSDYNESQRDHF